jgi:hypothetical protein
LSSPSTEWPGISLARAFWTPLLGAAFALPRPDALTPLSVPLQTEETKETLFSRCCDAMPICGRVHQWLRVGCRGIPSPAVLALSGRGVGPNCVLHLAHSVRISGEDRSSCSEDSGFVRNPT